MNIAKIFLLGMFLGVIGEAVMMYIYEFVLKKPFRIHHHFKISQKISLFSLPVWGALALFVTNSYTYSLLFLFACIIGPILELFTGKLFHSLFGIHLWTYKYGVIGRYTSIYAIPYWGGAAVLFALIAQGIGI